MRFVMKLYGNFASAIYALRHRLQTSLKSLSIKRFF